MSREVQDIFLRSTSCEYGKYTWFYWKYLKNNFHEVHTSTLRSTIDQFWEVHGPSYSALKIIKRTSDFISWEVQHFIPKSTSGDYGKYKW
jgi:hypothetical protein